MLSVFSVGPRWLQGERSEEVNTDSQATGDFTEKKSTEEICKKGICQLWVMLAQDPLVTFQWLLWGVQEKEEELVAEGNVTDSRHVILCSLDTCPFPWCIWSSLYTCLLMSTYKKVNRGVFLKCSQRTQLDLLYMRAILG